MKFCAECRHFAEDALLIENKLHDGCTRYSTPESPRTVITFTERIGGECGTVGKFWVERR
jgi:hypothetical protein